MMDLDAYVTERGGEWHRLEVLANRRTLGPADADELVLLYQRAATHLSVLRSRNPDPVLLADLSRLVLAGRSALHRGRGGGFWRAVADFAAYRLPGALYRTRRWWLTTGVLLVACAAALIRYLGAHPEVIALFAGDAEVQRVVSRDFVGYYSRFRAENFALQVWTNNALLTAQCLASGVLVLPVFYLLAQNLLNTGLVGAMMTGAGAGDTFLIYLAPHGLLELTCLFVGAGVGLRLGWAWIAPGPLRTRRRSLVAWVREGMVVAAGLVPALAVAGVLEAFVTPSALPAALRIGIGALAWLGFLAYALAWGRIADRRRPADPDGADLPAA
ncbi:stage II sporulation protein M [Actinoplanes teichomyceticus]|uniref:Putative membrane protein SpoIIM required for sporulation n=1 Tax=Actinoplanes teichomyceticus TaxID=1867 RepID=A0A561VM93_ACTTI|nr:stage II sporulation protein M [Actinoplanes teichomyceticus]TWG12717.1 putative membrane protein SpoIIM required for sporulation [Actinoplanes teichomyceticus]GIF13450.1 membrane protein [Actinoplanes teichomyceticus]